MKRGGCLPLKQTSSFVTWSMQNNNRSNLVFKDYNHNQNLLLPPSLEELIDHGHVTLKEVYLDGTKIEANANRYTFVWGRAIKTSKERIKKQLKELCSYAEKVAKEELENNDIY